MNSQIVLYKADTEQFLFRVHIMFTKRLVLAFALFELKVNSSFTTALPNYKANHFEA